MCYRCIHLEKLIWGIILTTLMIGGIVGISCYIYYIFINEENHTHTATCDIEKCTVSNGTCYSDSCANRYSCTSMPFTCYKFNVAYSLNTQDKKFNTTSASNYDSSGWYPTICESNTTTCDYDDRNIQNTLTLNQIIIPNVLNVMGIIVICIVQVAITIGVWAIWYDFVH